MNNIRNSTKPQSISEVIEQIIQLNKDGRLKSILFACRIEPKEYGKDGLKVNIFSGCYTQNEHDVKELLCLEHMVNDYVELTMEYGDIKKLEGK